MNINDCKLWISDIDEVLTELPELEELVDKRIMITGCCGLICSTIIDVLIRWNTTHNGKIIIVAAGRNINKINERFFPFVCEEWFISVLYDSSSSNNILPLECDYIIHGASNASPNKIMQEPVETMISNFIGTKNLLDYGKLIGIKRLLFISSSEVYGQKERVNMCGENDFAGIDILNIRNSYSIGKCAAETLCASYTDEYKFDTVIVRPGHIYGPTALSSDNRIASLWAFSSAKGEDIIMKSEGTQVRSYCYCLDCASAILIVLLKGKSAKAYNISNPDSVISINELAQIISAVAKVGIKRVLPSFEEKIGFNPMNNSALDSAELLLLGWKGLFDAYKGFNHTIEILKEKN